MRPRAGRTSSSSRTTKIEMSRCPDSRRESIISAKVGMRNSDRTDCAVTFVLILSFVDRSASSLSAAPTPGSVKNKATMSPDTTQIVPIVHMP